MATETTLSPDQHSELRTRLFGRRLILARVVWVAAVTLIVVPFLAMLPAYYTLLQTVCTGTTCAIWQPTPGSAPAMQKLGLSVDTYATFTLALTLASAFLCFAIGAVIFWRRSDDWMALLVALGVVALEHSERLIGITGELLSMASTRHRFGCTWRWNIFSGLLTLSQWAVCATMDALAATLLACIGHGLSLLP